MTRLGVCLLLLATLAGCELPCWGSGPERCRAERQLGYIHAGESRHPPPAGGQFDEGPVLVRLPSTTNTATRFIF